MMIKIPLSLINLFQASSNMPTKFNSTLISTGQVREWEARNMQQIHP